MSMIGSSFLNIKHINVIRPNEDIRRNEIINNDNRFNDNHKLNLIKYTKIALGNPTLVQLPLDS